MNALGQSVSIVRVTSPVYDADDELNESASTITTTAVQAVLSSPDETWAMLDEGRVDMPRLVLTLPSTTDVSLHRNGRPDRFIVGGITYQAVAIRDAAHPMTGVVKLSVALGPLPGRG